MRTKKRLSPERAHQLVNTLTYSRITAAGTLEIAQAVILTAATYARDENKDEVRTLGNTLHRERRLLSPGSVPNEMHHDWALQAARDAATLGAHQGLLTLLAATDEHEELVSHLLWQTTQCSPHCAGHPFALRELLETENDVDGCLLAAYALCWAESSQRSRHMNLPAYTRFLEEAARSGYATANGDTLRNAAGPISWLREELSKEVLETYYALVVDGTDPKEALGIAQTLNR